MPRKSPLGPSRFPNLLPVAGVRLAAGAAGVRQRSRTDLMLTVFPEGASVAGVFTKSTMAAANIAWCRKALGNGRARALVTNSGNANAFTGVHGQRAVREVAATAARLLGCRQRDVFIASTGVIAEKLPVGKIVRALPRLAKGLAGGNWRQAANAMRTTDTFSKGCCRVARIDGRSFVVNGIAKGSGMIAPDMATMLAFIFTNAAIPPDVLQRMLVAAVARSFNCITVDGDTSTSDMVLAFATGKGGEHKPVTNHRGPRLADFRRRLDEVCTDLAQQIVRDGEGASKFVTVNVSGAASAGAARRIALAVANSPLVKTAVAGEDPNWGRVVMAVGKCGERADRDKLVISFGKHVVAERGAARAHYSEKRVAKYMKNENIDITIDVGVGPGRARVWTCDLTHDYVRINADYRS